VAATRVGIEIVEVAAEVATPTHVRQRLARYERVPSHLLDGDRQRKSQLGIAHFDAIPI